MASDEEEKKSSPFLSSHLALACHLRVTTLTIDLYISVIIWLEYYKAAFFTLAFFKIPAVEKSRNGQGKLAEIFAWESHDYRYATNVENSNKVTGGTRRQMLEYVRIRFRKKRYPQFKWCIKNDSEMYRSWWYVVRTNFKN